jgi:aminobenzoyl-glutamate utilization protein B
MKDGTKGKDFVISWIDEHSKEFYGYSNSIWSFAELGFDEFLSSRLLMDLLKERGFKVQEGVAGMPTAFIARWGSGKPVIGISGEYDALPGLSQDAKPEKNPVVEGAPGHGCGHNIFGVGSAIAAIAIKECLAKEELRGTVMFLGTPAEELAAGKAYMARTGLFQGIDAIMDWHPWYYNSANYDTCNGYFSVKYYFSGRTAHGNSPWHGRSALDGAVLMGHAIEILREHIPPGHHPDAANTINYTFSDVGPEYPAVVPDRATIWVVGRIRTSEEMEGIIARVHKCAEGASIATGTSVKRDFISAIHEKIPNKVLSSVLYRNLVEIGPPSFEPGEQEFARKMQRDLGVEETGLAEEIMEFREGYSVVCDNSEYSWFAPFAMAWITAASAGFGWHNWQVTASARGTIGEKAMVVAAKVLAASGVELLTSPQVIEKAKRELSQRLAGRRYKSLIPEGVNPPIDINRKTMEKYRELMEKHYEKVR